MFSCFVFQAEDGIRDLTVTGVQTCALPISYFQLVDYSAIRPELDDLAMAEWLTREHGVAAIPVSVFYQAPPEDLRLVRFCFAKREDTLRQAAENLCAI